MSESTTRSRSRRRHVASVGLAAVAAALALAACGGSEGKEGKEEASAKSGSQTSNVGVDKSIADMVPTSLRKKHVLRVATAAAYPPETFMSESGQITGSDPELGAAIAKLLGLSFHFVNVTDTELIPGLEAGRYELVMTGAYVEPERLEQVDFVTYQQGYAAFVAAANAKLPKITGIASVCGLGVAVPTGSAEASFLETENKQCPSSHQIDIQQYGDQNQANLAVISGRAQLTAIDAGVADSVAKASHGQLKVLATGFQGPRMGIEVAKGSPLGPAIHSAVEKLMSESTYKRILEHWGEGREALTETKLLTKPSETPSIEQILSES
jgi:polar amino acid transport system substrate-binding protein